MSIKLAKQYCKNNLPIIPVPYQQKAPAIEGWPTLTINNDNCEEYFSSAPSNVSVLLGKPGTNLVDLDIDCEEAKLFAQLFAPETGFMYGRVSNKTSHYLYRLPESDEAQPVKYQHPKHGCLLEIRGKGQATLLPGSVHPDGEDSKLEGNGEIAGVSYSDLHRSAALIAACALLTKEGIPKGNRQDVALGFSGLLCKAGYDLEQVKLSVYHLAKALHDEEADKRKSAAEDTFKKYQQGKPIAGITALRSVLPTELIDQLASWLGVSTQQDVIDLVSTLNDQYAFVIVGGKQKILNMKAFESGEGSSFLMPDAFKGLMKRHKVCLGKSARGTPLIKSYAEVWLEHEDRRTYSDIIFDPSETLDKDAFNLWRGFSVQPSEEGSCDKFLEHLHQVICKGDQGHYEWFLAWLADIVQNPGEKPGTAVAIRGAQGTGKSTVGQYFGDILKRHFLTVNNPKHGLGTFNAHLAAKILVMFEEAFWAGDKVSEGVLKDMITNDRMNMERKGVDVVEVKNCMRIIATSNSSWMIPAAIDDRRFFVLSTSDKHAKDTAYFSALQQERENGGPARLLRYLLDLDISQVDLRNAPQTDALIEQKLQTMDMVGKFLFECLSYSRLYPQGTHWPKYIETQHLFRFFKQFAKQTGLPDRGDETAFGMGIRKYIPDLMKITKAMDTVDEETGQPLFMPLQGKSKKQVYEMPDLETARLLFHKVTGIPVKEPPAK